MQAGKTVLCLLSLDPTLLWELHPSWGLSEPLTWAPTEWLVVTEASGLQPQGSAALPQQRVKIAFLNV